MRARSSSYFYSPTAAIINLLASNRGLLSFRVVNKVLARGCELFCVNVILQEAAIFRNGLKMTFTQINYTSKSDSRFLAIS